MSVHKHYSCKEYNIKEFENNYHRSEHKFFPPTGIASFWDTVKNTVTFAKDVRNVTTDNENLTSKEYDNDKKDKRVVCRKVSIGN